MNTNTSCAEQATMPGFSGNIDGLRKGLCEDLGLPPDATFIQIREKAQRLRETFFAVAVAVVDIAQVAEDAMGEISCAGEDLA
jgi:hypothetical protein